MTAAVQAVQLPRYEHLFVGGVWAAPEDGGFIESIDPSTGRVRALAADRKTRTTVISTTAHVPDAYAN